MSQRVAYIDALRGFGILSVVYSHLVVMGLRGNTYHSPILPVINLYFMPLFFFLSGFLSGHIKDRVTDFKSFLKEMWSKMKYLLLPTVVMFILSRFYFGTDLWSGIVDSYKGGYWFTYVLFVVIATYTLIHLSLARLKSWGVIHTAIAFFFVFLSEHVKTAGEWVSIASADFVLAYYFYFFMGTLAAGWKELFLKTISTPCLSSIILVLSLMPIFRPMPYYLTDICRLLLVIVLLIIFRHYGGFLAGNHLLARTMRTIGKHTLEIYFLQYFLLFKIDFVSTLLTPLTNDYCFRGSSCYAFIELLIVGCLSLLISLACVLIRKLLEPFPIASKLCFGK